MADPEHRPFQEPPASDELKRQHATRQLVLAYKRCFTSDSGKLVLADLKHKFGWDRWECDNTEDAQQIARRVAAKGPIFHIEKQLTAVFKDGKRKPRGTPEP